MAISKFQQQRRGNSPVYVCRICRHQTRETGRGEESVELCAACYELAGLENAQSDNGVAALVGSEPGIRALIEQIEKRGRGDAGWREVFASVI